MCRIALFLPQTQATVKFTSKNPLRLACFAAVSLLPFLHAQEDASSRSIPSLNQLGAIESLQFQKLDVSIQRRIGSVNDIAQDRSGFIWFATKLGLVRFDGYRIRVFNSQIGSPDSITHDTCWTLHLDTLDRLWVGTTRGLSRYNERAESFESYLVGKTWPNPTLSNQVNAILHDSAGQVLVSTEAGYIYRFSEAENRFVQLNSARFGTIKSMTIDDQDRLWIGVENGVIRFEASKRQTKRYTELFPGSSPNNFINSVFYRSDTEIWVGSSNAGAAVLNGDTQEIQLLPVIDNSDSYVNHISLGAEGAVWVATNAGIAAYEDADLANPLRISNSSNNGSVPASNINTFMIDRQNNVWIGSRYEGVAISSQSRQFRSLPLHRRNPEALPNTPVSALLVDSFGNLWIGGSKTGLDMYPADGGDVIRYRHNPDEPNSISPQPVLKVFEDSGGDIWLGTFRGGLHHYRKETNDFIRYLPDPENPNSISGLDIRDIAEDERGNLWINAHGTGVDYLDRSTSTFTRYRSSSARAGKTIINNWCFAIHYDHLSRLWIGTSMGVSVLNANDGLVTNYQADQLNKNSLSNSMVLDVFQDSQNRIWLGTEDGLNLYQSETNDFRSFSDQDGLPHRSVVSIIEDVNGMIWVGTYNGLARLNTETFEITSYQSNNTPAMEEFFEGSAVKDSFGNLYFGHSKGVTYFHPDQIEEARAAPKAFITGFAVAGVPLEIQTDTNAVGTLRESILHVKEVALRHDQDVFTLDFATLSFVELKKNQFQYRLDGFDRDWRLANGMQSVTYTNLDPGKYLFRVKASNANGDWGESETHMLIAVRPPLWGAVWVKSAIALLASGLAVLLLLRWHQRHLRERQRLESKLNMRSKELKQVRTQLDLARDQILEYGNTLESTVDRRVDELKRAKNAAERSDILKSAFLSTMSREIRAPMNTIIGFLHIINNDDINAEERNRFSEIIQQSSRSLLALIDEILDISNIENGVSKIEGAPTNINLVCDELITEFRKRLAIDANRKIILSLRNGDDASESPDLCAFIDSGRLRRVLWNLMLNVINNTVEGTITLEFGVVRNGSRAGDDLLQFALITDSGDLPPAPNDRDDASSGIVDQKSDGSTSEYGIGISITNKLAELMDGKLISNDGSQEGPSYLARFPFLPIAEPLPSPATKAESPQSDWKVPDLSAFAILVAEDEISNFEYIEKVLSPTSVKIEWAADGKQALEQFEKGKFDLILLDLRMPILDGYELAKFIRKQDQSIPIIAQSAFSSQENRDASQRSGANEHINKPYLPETLINAISRYLLPIECSKNDP